jgi:RNA polymerase sigma-70 factor (ECF subfamily)
VSTEHRALDFMFQQIYRQRFEDVGRWARALGARSPDVPDLVHEIFIVVYRRLAQFDERNVAGWLYQITRRKMRDYRRLSWIKHLFTERTASTFECSAASGVDQLKQLENHERTALMERILDTLPANQRAAFVLFELEGLSGAEIAQLQQVPINTVWGRIYKARCKLQQRLLTPHEPSNSKIEKVVSPWLTAPSAP